MTDPPPALALRPERPDDRPLMFALFAQSRAAEMALVDWTAAQQQAFLEHQFAAQTEAYRGAYAGGRFDVVELDGLAIGRLYLADLGEELRIVDIALLPMWCGRGIGSALLADVLAEADAAARPVSLHVEHWNPARRLYERLGFVPVSEDSVYVLMRRGQLKTAS
ncbi:MAG: GNAT family N-acetyltransferase [Ilumatobacteraceae bacterium]|nr:GNAT family N-acetyltransferase [Ilumatobacter sp.]